MRCSATAVVNDGKMGDAATYYYNGLLVELIIPPQWGGDTARVRLLGGRWLGAGYFGSLPGDCFEVGMDNLVELCDSAIIDNGG